MKNEFKSLDKVRVIDYGCYKPEDIHKTGICYISYINHKTDVVCFSDIPVQVRPTKNTSFKLSDVRMLPVLSEGGSEFIITNEPPLTEGDFIYDGEMILPFRSSREDVEAQKKYNFDNYKKAIML